MNISKFFKTGRVTRRDLGNRASSVDRAYIKRPSSRQIYWGQINVFYCLPDILFENFDINVEI